MNRKANFRNAPPRAGAMLESLRGLGYTTAAALADIVDNSISAGATAVRIDFNWNSASSRVTVLDNGWGWKIQNLKVRCGWAIGALWKNVTGRIWGASEWA